MAVRPIYVLLISLLLYEHASGDYCKSEDNPSIRFCQNGSISGSKVYINGSSVQTKEYLVDRRCVCYLKQSRNNELIVDGKESCFYCGLKVRVGNDYIRSSYYASQAHGWGLITINDANVTMTLGLDEGTGSLNTAFCITIQENRPDIPLNLTLTCEDTGSISSAAIFTSLNVITTSSTIVQDTTKSQSPSSAETSVSPLKTGSSSSLAISTSPNVIKTSSTMVRDTTKSQSSTSAETSMSLPKTDTTNRAGNTNVTDGPKANNTNTATKTTTTANHPGEDRFQKEVIIPAAAAGGGGGLLVILVILIVVCCLRKKRQDAENPIDMKELETSDVIMTDNTTYGISIDTNTNSDPHIQSHLTGDVYAVVNKQGTSNVFLSADVPHMQVDETGVVYAVVNKGNVQEIPIMEHSLEKSGKPLLQTRSDRNNITAVMTPSNDYADINIDSDL